MIDMIEQLVKLNHAYVINDHVLFDISSYDNYGELANRSLDEMIAGARIEVAPFKRNPADFVLWKPCADEDYAYGFDSPWGRGRPGWHIECSAMSFAYLGVDFDIHGGGADLMFPHHENELAQSKCANVNSSFTRYWIHNGFLTVNGEKMSKSLGNFKTVRDIIDEGFSGNVIRYFYLTAHYKKPLDLSKKALEDAQKAIKKIFSALKGCLQNEMKVSEQIVNFISDDMNTPAAIAYLHELVKKFHLGDDGASAELIWSINFLGFKIGDDEEQDILHNDVIKIANDRLQAKLDKNWRLADSLRDQITEKGYKILDTANSYKLEKIK